MRGSKARRREARQTKEEGRKKGRDGGKENSIF